MRRTCLALALLLAAPFAAGEGAHEGAPRPFIEQSLVLAPENAGDWRLARANDYPGNPGAGVALNYVHAGHPDVRLDLFVYPIGRLGPAEAERALAGEIDVVRQQLQQMAADGRYESPRFEDPVVIWLPPPPRTDDRTGEAGAADAHAGAQAVPSPDDADASAAEPVDTAGQAGTEAALEGLLARDAARDRRIPGRKLSIQLGREGQPLTSRAYVFYRGLYFYKGRITASHQAIAPGVLDALADQAMETLVPAVRVNSTGGCSHRVVAVDPEADESTLAQDLLAGLLEAQARAEREHCLPTLDETVPAGWRAVRLVYPPDAWGAPPPQPPGRHKSTAKPGS